METGTSANSRPAEETAKQFQVYLRKYENDEKLVISEATQEPGSKLGDNYTSIMIRTKVVGKRGDGSPYAKSFMIKNLSKTRPAGILMELPILFSNETQIYEKVLPLFGIFGPRCVHTDKENIIMEDLGEKGYITCERRNFLDLDHIVFTLKVLAKFHAIGITTKLRNPSLFNDLVAPLEEAIYTDSGSNTVAKFTEMSIKSMMRDIEMVEPQTQELQDLAAHLNSYKNTLFDELKQMICAPKKKYDTITHGDTWTNNLLFLHDQNDKIMDLKMVDYQMARHISVAFDIHYLIYTSAQPSLIEKSYESLIKIYHSALLEELRQLDVDEEILTELGPKWLETELRASAIYGMLCGCWIVHPILAEEEELLTFENVDLLKNTDVFNFEQLPPNQKKIDRIKTIVLHYYRRFCLDIINSDLEPISNSK